MLDAWVGDVAIVTGAASGLGAATAEALAAAGLKVAVLDMNAEEGAAKAGALGGAFFAVDVSDADSVEAAVSSAAALGPVRVVVNCAGIAPGAKTVSRGAAHPADMFAKTIGVNLIGTFHVATIAAVHMAEASPTGPDGQRGVIVNTASIAAYEGQVGQIAYSASKGGVAGMTLPMARDLADKGVRVCALAPGLFRTPMVEGLPEEVQASLGGQAPFPPRLGKPEEFAKLVLHIVDNPMLNGEVIRLDGAVRLPPR